MVEKESGQKAQIYFKKKIWKKECTWKVLVIN